jgi:aspartate aminotransferase-like enzyme
MVARPPIMAANPFIKHYLMTAGPTPLPPEVQNVMSEPLLYHRAPAFVELYEKVLGRLPAIFRTENDVLTFAASGTGAMESAVANLTEPGRPVLACSAGKFGERWIELGEAFGADVVRYEPGWGQRLDPAEVGRLLSENDAIDVVFATLSETSTGIVHDVAGLAAAAREHDAILVVDAISGLGATDLRQDEWGIDVVVSGSQKALMCPPGLAFTSASPRALELAGRRGAGHYYFSWERTRAAQAKGDSPFTPAVTLVRALDVALDLIEAEGLENVLARHDLLARAARAGVAGMGLELYGDPDERSTVVTAVELPESIDGGKVPKILRDGYNITANGGQSQLKGKILRIAHTGYFGAFDIIVSIAGLEMTLADLGHQVELGSGVAAAQRELASAGVEVPA